MYLPFFFALNDHLIVFYVDLQGTLKSGQEVAVKALSAESRQGVREFLTEIDVITNVKHPNLVELLGCCIQDNNRILVYEYLENGSLDHALLGKIINNSYNCYY
jgi:serine/threonine protein kinase